MKEWQIKWIEDNQKELFDKTTCHVKLLDDLSTQKQFLKHEVDELTRIGLNDSLGRYKQVRDLYSFLKTKDAYDVLIEVLKDNCQTDAAQILEDGRDTEESQQVSKKCRIQNYLTLPKGLELFLKSSNPDPNSREICLVSTIDCDLTATRLLEVKGVLVVKWENNILNKECAATCTSWISCGNNVKEVLKDLISWDLKTSKKIVVINKEKKQDLQKYIKEISNSLHIIVEEDDLNWNDLSTTFQNKLLSRKVDVQGRMLPLDEFTEEWGQPEAKKEINGQLLIDLINNTTPVIFKDTLPPKLSYYVERRLRSRSQLSKDKIFGDGSEDIFAISGLQRHELSELVKRGMSTDTSRDQIKQKSLTVRYILLQLKSDFELICQRASQSVHWIHHKDNKFYWVKSNGSMNNIQLKLDDFQDEYDESSFLKKIYEKKLIDVSQQAVCISDSPGMGKSILLSEIGRKLSEIDSKSIIVFQKLSEFMKKIRGRFRNKKPPPPKKLLQYLLCSVTTSAYSEALIKFVLETESWKIILLLDAFDEVPLRSQERCQQLLQLLSGYSKNVRVFTTTRPHFLHALEDKFEVLGWSILPFTESDQHNFLVSFWKECGGTSAHLDIEKLKNIATQYVSALKTNWNDKKRAIAGIPLQCLLITEVYEDEALNCSNPENNLNTLEFTPSPNIGTVTDLYTKLVEKKLQTYKNKFPTKLDLRLTHNQHSYKAFKYLFSKTDDFDKSVENEVKTISDKAMLDIGIFEWNTKSNDMQFIHRTFAEYFVATTFAESFIQSSSNIYTTKLKKILEFLFQDVLELSKLSVKNVPKVFEWEGMLYHVNHLINDKNIIFSALVNDTTSTKKLANLALAIVSSDLGNIFNMFVQNVELNFMSRNKAKIFTEQLIFVAIQHSSLSLVKTVSDHFHRSCDKQLASLRFEDSKLKTLLHAAAVRGHYAIFDFLLLNSDGFLDQVKNCKKGSTFGNLLHACVECSHEDSYPIVVEKIHIIKLLLGRNKSLLEYDFEGHPPLMCKHVNYNIIIELIENGADVKDRSTLLCKTKEYLSNKEYSQLLEKLKLLPLPSTMHNV